MGEWADDTIATIKQLWADGYSASQIARQVGRTRNAVIGKICRMGLQKNLPGAPLRQSRVTQSGNVRRIVVIKPMPAPVARLAEPEAVGPLADFPPAGTCRFIAGDVQSGDWRCCGHPAKDHARPFCSYHMAICYQPAPNPRGPRKPQAVEIDAEAA